MNNAASDDFSRTPVANFSLRPWWYLLTIELGVLMSIPLFVVGGQLGVSLSLPNLLIATFMGGLILGAIGGLTARLGALTRSSTAMLARSTFGSYGAGCIGLLLALGITGWWAVQTDMFSDAFTKLIQTLFHVAIPKQIMIAVGGCAMITTAALGIRAIGKVAYFAAPLLVAGVTYGLYSLFSSGGWHRALIYQPPTKIAISLGSAIAIVASGWIVGAAMNPDFARFARNTKHALAYALTHYSFNYPLMLIICGIMAIGFETKDLLVHLVPPNLSWLLLLLIMLATWAANDCNLYSSSLGLTVVFPKFKRSTLAIAGGAIGIFLSELGLASHIISFLTFLGIVIAPIAGVFIVNAIDPRDPRNKEAIAPVPRWRFGHLSAWLCGVILGYLTTPKADLGLELFRLTTIPTLDAVLGASIAMAIIMFVEKRKNSRHADDLATSLSHEEELPQLETSRL